MALVLVTGGAGARTPSRYRPSHLDCCSLLIAVIVDILASHNLEPFFYLTPAGYIGTHTVVELLNAGFRVVVRSWQISRAGSGFRIPHDLGSCSLRRLSYVSGSR